MGRRAGRAGAPETRARRTGVSGASSRSRDIVFLNVFRQGGGGLEHKNSTLLTAAPPRAAYPARNFRWLSFVSHEYFHAFNVKRLRPVELGPFDYEHPPTTSSLWIAEGFTSYYGELIVVRSRAGHDRTISSRHVSSHIDQLQNSPGRLVQSLEQSSLDVWSSGTSGVGRNRDKTVNYYVKGPIVGFLLDARIQRATAGKKSLDDVMRQAYKLYGGERGFTPDQFRLTAQEIAGVDLKEWFRKNISSTEELDYTEALDWFGLRFAPDPPPDPEKKQPAEEEVEARDPRGRHGQPEVPSEEADCTFRKGRVALVNFRHYRPLFVRPGRGPFHVR